MPPDITAPQFDRLSEIADFITRARSAVERSGRKRELVSTPAAEMPGRFARALLSVVQGVAVVRPHQQVQNEDLAAAVRVGLDSLPPVRRYLLGRLAAERALTESDLVQGCRHQWSRSHRTRARRPGGSRLGLTEHEQQKVDLSTGKAPKLWRLRAEWRVFCGACSDLSIGVLALAHTKG